MSALSSTAPERASGASACLVLDMISCWDFPDAELLLPGALRVAPRIAALAQRCRRAGVPVIYANDNRGRWRSDFRALVALSAAQGGPAAKITQALAPQEQDYFVLKPKHSAFFSTPLDLLLKHLAATRLVITGVASDQCVLATAADARMRDYQVIVPRDCAASQSAWRDKAVLRQFEEVHGLSISPSSRIRFAGGPKRPRAQGEAP